MATKRRAKRLPKSAKPARKQPKPMLVASNEIVRGGYDDPAGADDSQSVNRRKRVPPTLRVVAKGGYVAP